MEYFQSTLSWIEQDVVVTKFGSLCVVVILIREMKAPAVIIRFKE